MHVMWARSSTFWHRTECAELRKAIEAERASRERLLAQRDRLLVQETALGNRVAPLHRIAATAHVQSEALSQQIAVANKQTNAAVASLAQSCAALSSVLPRNTPTSQQHAGQRSRHAWDVAQLEKVEEAEVQYTQHVTSFCKKQFHESFVPLAVREDVREYELIELLNPSIRLVQGRTDDEYESQCAEIKRLQSLEVSVCVRLCPSPWPHSCLSSFITPICEYMLMFVCYALCLPLSQLLVAGIRLPHKMH